MGPDQGFFRIVRVRALQTEGSQLTLSFGLNHYGAKYTTGKRLNVGDVVPFRIGFGSYEQTFEKDGKAIGVRGHNEHPYIGECDQFG
jgi:hypothetical protein